MLKELASSKEKLRRRWFSDDYFDLIVWMDLRGTVSGFQLCYEKHAQERALTWTREKGYSHERIDDGEANPAKNLSPILVPDGACRIGQIRERFLHESADIDPEVRSFILDTLQKYR